MSWILDIGSGRPANISAQSMLYGNGVPDVIGNFDRSSGHVQWADGKISPWVARGFDHFASGPA